MTNCGRIASGRSCRSRVRFVARWLGLGLFLGFIVERVVAYLVP